MAAPAPAARYILSADSNEAERLELQHYCILSCQGYYIHPEVKLPPTGARIAELCTGTAIWLRELAPSNPSAEFHGFDLTDSMYPDRATLPQNVQLHLANIKTPFDSRWHGYFDFVHLRWIQAAMSKDEWAPTVRNISTLLKPGGYLMWIEDDRAISIRHALRPVAPLGAYEKSLAVTANQAAWKPPKFVHLDRFNRDLINNDRADGLNFGYMNMDALMADPNVGGLEDVICDGFLIHRLDDGGKVGSEWSNVGVKGVESVLSSKEKAGIKVEGFDPVEYATKAKEEIARGGQWISRAMVFVGKKKA